MTTIPGMAAVGNSASPMPLSSKTSAESTSSFADQLSAALQQFLSGSKTDSQIEIDTRVTPGQNSDTRQFTITVKTPGAQAAPTPPTDTALAPQTASAPGAPLLTPDSYPMALLFYGALHADAVATPAPATAVPLPTASDAYWALQPPAVQVLRTLDPDARLEEAQKLLQQGYLIDYPIMVQGWSPLETMRARQADGYTWVPSFMQKGIEEMPGVAYPGVTPYDPNQPPPGSIKVSTDFALGTLDDPTVTPSRGVQGSKPSAT